MFDIGWSELLIVLVVALVVVGPKDLPRLMRQVGRWVAKARAMADQFKASFDEMARESELDELRQEIAALRRNNPVTRLQDEINNSIKPPDLPPTPTAPEPAAPTQIPHAEADPAAVEAVKAEASAPDIHAEPEPELPDAHKAPLEPDHDPHPIAKTTE